MTLIDEKKAIEVHVWDEYLIFAESLGIADKVANNLKNSIQQNIVKAITITATTG